LRGGEVRGRQAGDSRSVLAQRRLNARPCRRDDSCPQPRVVTRVEPGDANARLCRDRHEQRGERQADDAEANLAADRPAHWKAPLNCEPLYPTPTAGASSSEAKKLGCRTT